ncbi:hypothetical protein CSAL01_12086 [Colletotrichum salicis]|uniref:Uncharacterized protein n=1 Tax=Colletotrichum salicis TaxID=1209931 RepID=A0A135V2B6_9PEZI|nr:hypothetical protein CSAL01_12086 [Colletotrichum salicis]
MAEDHQLATIATAVVVTKAVAVACLDDLYEIPRALPMAIDPGGTDYAVLIAQYYLAGAESQFQASFCLTKSEFQRLLRLLTVGGHLKRTRYQTAEQKQLIFLYLVGQTERGGTTALRGSGTYSGAVPSGDWQLALAARRSGP